MMKRPLAFVLIVSGVGMVLGGCVHVGPSTVPQDRFDYSEAIADSWKSQMLLNLVKIRYNDAPVFLDVGQVVAGYSFSRSLGATAGANVVSGGNAPAATLGTLGASAGGSLNISPTVTYAPMTGERFARSLMTPIPPSVIMNFIQAGNPIEDVFRTAVQSINDVDNRRVGRGFVRRANPEFYALLPNLGRLQSSGDIGMRVEQVGGETKLTMILRPRMPAAEERALANAAKILGLDPATREFPIVYGNVERTNKEIALLTRSIYEILTDIASYVTVPEVHVKEGRVRPTPGGDVGPEGPIPALIRVTSSVERPADAFASVPYLGYWFSVDSRDIPSKQMLSSLMLIFTFVETGSKEAAPVLTIPTTR